MTRRQDQPQANPQEAASPPTGPTSRRVPEGDTHERLVCDACGFINYENPKVVVGAVAVWDGKVLLCRRAIEPRRGYWTIPAGYMELNETTADGARREAREEACAELDLIDILAVYTIPRISQVQILYRAMIRDGLFAPGAESLETELFAWDAIPWDEIAFPSVHWALDHYQKAEGQAVLTPFSNPPGATGADPASVS